MDMTKRERIMCALSGGQPDRMPVAPDTSYMIPCKMTGKTFQDVLMRYDPPVWDAYLDVVDYYDFDGWYMYGAVQYLSNSQCQTRYENYTDSEGGIHVTQIVDTPKGELRQVTYFPTYDCQTPTEKFIKNFKEDFPKIKYLYPEITGINADTYSAQVKKLGDKGMMGIGIFPPGMSSFFYLFNGMDEMTFAYYDERDLFLEFCDMYEKDQLRKLELILDLKPDSVLTGGSGSITLSSPEIWDELALPAIKKITKICKEAGIITGIHSCGKEMHLVKRCAEETDLNYVNPLEIAPMGDSDLRIAKRLYGDKLALMGNIHTTDIMLYGTPKDVRRESLIAMLDAGVGGGFVLSTGDQPGRDTPEENLREMVGVCREFGQYPLNTDAIKDELLTLGVKYE